MPIERRIREGAERNAGVLDPDVDRFLDSVVHQTRRRQVIHRSLIAAASAAAAVVAIVLGPSVLDGIGNTGGTVPGSEPTHSVGPSVTPGVAFLTGTFTRSIPEGTAVVRASGIAGTWTIKADANGTVRLLAPGSFAGAKTSRAFDMQADSLRTSAFGSDICVGVPDGTYRWTVQSGFLVLTPLSDRCDARVAVLGAGPWAIDS
jgi:ferric-dicitrate binding protein FerR (iron transport regulator)